MVYQFFMLLGGIGTICMIQHIFPGLDLYSIHSNPAKHLITAAKGFTVDDLDRDLSKLYNV